MTAKRVFLLAAALLTFGVCCAILTLFLFRGSSAMRLASTATVVKQIQGLSQLVTVKYVLEKTVVLEDPKYFRDLIPLGENRIILLAQGEVKAGVDFSRLTAEDVSISGKRITLRVPAAVVTDAYLVERQTRVLDWKTGLLRSFDKDLEQTARRNALTEITRAARQSGIEQEASERARKQLGEFLQALGFEKVEIRVGGK